jgi:hypothetical protein
VSDVFSTKFYKIDHMKIYKIGGVYNTYGGDEKYNVVVGKRTKRDQLDYLVVEGRITLQ